MFTSEKLARGPRGIVSYIRRGGSRSANAAAYFVDHASEDGMTQKSLAKAFRISQPTLSEAIKRHRTGPRLRQGRPPYLNNDQSEALHEWINFRLSEMNAPTRKEIQLRAAELRGAGQRLPCIRWVKNWMNQNGFILRIGKIVPRSTVYIDPVQIQAFIAKYSSWIYKNGDTPNHIWNFDETRVSINQSGSKLLVATVPGIQNPLHHGGNLRARVTLGVAASASGLSIRTHCLVPETGWKLVLRRDFIPINMRMYTEGSGWQTKVSFR